MNFLNRLLTKGLLVRRCSHRFSWPRVDSDGRYYQRCSHCGVAYEYDWNKMRLTNQLVPASIADSSVHLARPLPLAK